MIESVKVETHTVLIQCLVDDGGDPPEMVAAGIMEEIARDCERVRASSLGHMTCSGRVGDARLRGSLVSPIAGARCAVSGRMPRGQALLDFCLAFSVRGLACPTTHGLVQEALVRAVSRRRGVQLLESSCHPRPEHDKS